MPKGFKIAFIILTGFIGLWLILQILSTIVISRSLPKTEGNLELPGLHSQADVYRCGYHIPHILAKNEHDLFFIQGYVTAQDRIWQMDLWRRIANGRLAEIFGKPGLPSDSLMRTIGLGRLAEDIVPHLSVEVKNTYQAYADGINAYIQQNRKSLPFEFMILQYKPEPWRIEDCISISRWFAWEMTSQWKTEILLLNILKRVGPQKTKLLFPAKTNLHDYQYLKPIPDMRFTKSFVLKTISYPFETGSNGWVLSSRRTNTGNTLLATDPHLALTSPSIFYEIHLDGGDFHVQGLSLPGLPGVIIGQNEHIAWGLTNLMADDQDLFIERIHPSNPDLVYHKGGWESLSVVEENISIKGDSTISLKIKRTRNGPVISDYLTKKHSGLTLSVKWTGLNIGDEGLTYYNINKAKNWFDFRKALQSYCVTPQHFLYADQDGNIGLQAAGPVPIRSHGCTCLPRPGDDLKFQWQGTVSWERMPSLYNPQKGLIITANYPLDDSSADNISTLWPVPWRRNRIQDLISGKEILSIQDCKNIQTDTYSEFARKTNQWILDCLEGHLDSDDKKRSARLLTDWDGQLRTGSSAAALSQVLMQKLIQNIFQDELGNDIYNRLLSYQNILLQALDRLMRGEDPSWFDNVDTPDICETQNDIILVSFQNALEFLMQEIHINPDKWSWGELHNLTFQHPFGDMPLFNRIFNIGPFPVGGSGTSVNCFGYLFGKPFETAWGPGARVIFNLEDPDNSVSVIPTGQSGQFQDEHYNNQTPLFLGNMFHPMLMDTSKIRQSGWDHLYLTPGGQHE